MTMQQYEKSAPPLPTVSQNENKQQQDNAVRELQITVDRLISRIQSLEKELVRVRQNLDRHAAVINRISSIDRG